MKLSYRIIALFLIISIVSPCTFAADYSSSSTANLWDSYMAWQVKGLFDASDFLGEPYGIITYLIGKVDSHFSGDVCSSTESPDGYHHASYLLEDTFGEDKHGYYCEATCTFCGNHFKVYGQDVEEAYNEYVDDIESGEDRENLGHSFSFPVYFIHPGTSQEQTWIEYYQRSWDEYLSEYNTGANHFSGVFQKQVNSMSGEWRSASFTADTGDYTLTFPTPSANYNGSYRVFIISEKSGTVYDYNMYAISNHPTVTFHMDSTDTYYIRVIMEIICSSVGTESYLTLNSTTIEGEDDYSIYLPIQRTIPATPHIDPAAGTYTNITDNSVSNITNVNFDWRKRHYDFDIDGGHHLDITYGNEVITVVDTDPDTGDTETNYYYYVIDPFTDIPGVLPVESVPDYLPWLERFKVYLFTRLDSIIEAIKSINIEVTNNESTVVSYRFTSGPSLVYIPIEPTLSINPEIGIDGVLELFPDAEINLLPINGDIDLSAALELALNISAGDIISQETNENNSVTYHTNEGDYVVTDYGPYIAINDGDNIYYVWRDTGKDVPWLRAWLDAFKIWLGEKLDGIGFDITNNYTDDDTHGTKTLFQWLLELIKTLIEGIVQGLADGISYVISHVIYAITDAFLQSIKFIHGIVDVDDAGNALSDFFDFFGNNESGSGFDWATEFSGVDDF